MVNGTTEITLDNKEYKIIIIHAGKFISQHRADTEGSPSPEGNSALACEDRHYLIRLSKAGINNKIHTLSCKR